MYRLFIIYIFLSAPHAVAHSPEEGDIYVSLSPMVYRTLTPPTIKDQSPYLIGGGIVAEGDLGKSGGIEVAMFYQNKYYLLHDERGTLVERAKRAYITTGYRHWFVNAFSIAASVTSAYTMGDPITVSSSPSGINGSDWVTSAQKIVEYGLELSVMAECFEIGNWSIITDIRYGYSLTKSKNESADLVGFIIGIKYLIPKRLLDHHGK